MRNWMRGMAWFILATVVVSLVGCSSLSRRTSLGESRPLWEPVDGPYGGPINDLALDSAGTLYAATNQGLFRRKQQSNGWTHLLMPARLDTGTKALGRVAKTETVKSLLIGQNGTLYVQTAFHLLRSGDRGGSWQSLDASLKRDTGTRPTDLTSLHPGSNGAVYLGTRRQGLLRSVDSGESWQRVLGGTPSPRIDVGPVAAAGRLYVAASTRGNGKSAKNGKSKGKNFQRLAQLYRSENGTDWQRPPAPPVLIRHFASGDDGRLVAAGWRWLDQGRRMELYESTDGGDSWTRGELPVDRLVALVPGPKGNLHAFGRETLYGRDSVGIWHRMTIRKPGFQGLRGSLQVLAWDKHQLYLATDLGIWRSNDRGQSWQSFQYAPRAGVVRRFATAGEQLYALAARRLHKASDDARHWHPIPHATAIRHLATRPDGVLFAANADDLYTYSATTDWHRRPLSDGGLSGLVVAGDGSLLIYAKRRLLRLTEDRIVPIDVPAFTGDLIGTLQAGFDGLVLADRVEGGMVRSLNNGRTWQAVPDSAFGRAEAPDGIDFFHFAPNGAIYAVDGSRLYRSINYGTSWRRLRTIGLSYQLENDQAPRNRIITGLATPSNGDLFAGTRRGGVYLWSKVWRAWCPILSGLPTGEIEALTVTPRGHLLAATPRGVYRTTVNARRLGHTQNGESCK
ncbi:MAG: WD40/YVTN/BNR-like repeat-containing protein [Desulfopila sp.]